MPGRRTLWRHPPLREIHHRGRRLREGMAGRTLAPHSRRVRANPPESAQIRQKSTRMPESARIRATLPESEARPAGNSRKPSLAFQTLGLPRL
eukprot:4243204-Alexandrium_andersonii.AAC.1